MNRNTQFEVENRHLSPCDLSSEVTYSQPARTLGEVNLRFFSCCRRKYHGQFGEV